MLIICANPIHNLFGYIIFKYRILEDSLLLKYRDKDQILGGCIK